MSATLTEIDTRELSLVDLAAVKRKFAMLKRDADMANDVAAKILKGDLEPDLATKFDALFKAEGDAAIDPATRGALKGLLQLMVGLADKLKGPAMQQLAALAGLDATAEAPPADAAAAKDAAKPDDDEVAKRGKGEQPGVNPEVAALMKRHQDEITALRKANEATAAKLRKKEVVDLVAKDYANLGNPETVAGFFMDLEGANLLKRAEPMLRAWSAQLAKGELFAELGVAGEGDVSTPEKRLEAAARELQKSSAGKLTYEQAFSKVYEDNADIRREIQKQRQQARG